MSLADKELGLMNTDEAIRHQLIAKAAYYRAERRGFIPGFEMQDWTAAESEILARMRGGSGGLNRYDFL